jgi:hypothetical protein
MREAHIFDLDVLISINSNVWIVSIDSPSIPVIKISLSEFNLIKKGIYKNHNSILNINGVDFWIPENLLNLLKIKVKKSNIDISNLAFSMQEFLNPNVIQHLDYTINTHNFIHLKNKPHDIYVFASNNSEVNYKPIIKKLDEELEKLGLRVKNYYFLSKTFNSRDHDKVANNKIKLCLQYLIGYKTNDNIITSEQLKKYNRVYLYDDDLKTLEFGKNINNILNFLKSNTEDESITYDVRNLIRNDIPVFVLSTITNNKINPIIYKEIILEWNHIVKTFEGFKI